MSMVTWFKGVLSTVLPSSIVGQGGEAFEKKAKPKLLDVTDGFYLVEEAKKLGVSFIRRSRLDFDDLKARLLTRRKARKHLAACYDLPEIVDEITEKIAEVSREDSYFKRMMG